MGLSQVEVSTREIFVGASSFKVRGLSSADLVRLVRAHYDQLNDLFKKIVQQGVKNPAEVEIAALAIIQDAPHVVASIVAIAADDDTAEGRANFNRLPIGVQLEAIDAVVELTFDTLGGPKKAVEIVKKIVLAFKS